MQNLGLYLHSDLQIYHLNIWFSDKDGFWKLSICHTIKISLKLFGLKNFFIPYIIQVIQKKKKKLKNSFIHAYEGIHWGNIEIIFELDLKKILTYFYKYVKFEKFANFPMYIACHVHCNPVHLQYIYMSSWAR